MAKMMMMRGVLLQRALRTASVCDRALIFTSAVHQSCPAVEELATSGTFSCGRMMVECF